MTTVHREPIHSSEWPDSLPPAAPEPKPYRHKPEIPYEEQKLTPAEVAEAFRVDAKTVTRWAKAGKLRCIATLGGHRRFYRAQVEALLRGETWTPEDPS